MTGTRARAAILLPALVASFPGGAAWADEAPVRVLYRFDAPVVRRGKEHDSVSLGGAPSWGEAGRPVLPRFPIRIPLPGGTTAGLISVRPAAARALAGCWRIEPGRGEHSPIDRKGPPPAAPDADVYAAEGPYPALPWTEHGVAWKDGRAIVVLTLHPVEWHPRTGMLFHRESFEVVVAPRRSLSPVGAAGGGGGGAEPLAYVIITRPDLAPAFEPLADLRTRGGLPARVVTTDWIRAHEDGRRPDGGDDDATRIRNFIAGAWSQGLRYVLLGGDADGDPSCAECEPPVVPARHLRTDALLGGTIPSDMYYGCLDGTFDEDRDGIYGEPTDGPGGGDVDFLAEVHVGRAPVDSLEEARNFVRKTLAYEAGDGPVLREALFVGEFLGFGGDYDWGGSLNDQIIHGSDAFIATQGFLGSPYAGFFHIETLYDRDAAGRSWPQRDLIERIERGVHLVNHVGHADISNIMKLTNIEIDTLGNEAFFLGYTQSCYAGAFDNERTNGSHGADSVVEHLLAGPGGAVAFVANSRRGWAGSGNADGPSQRFNRAFWDAAFRLGALRWGEANDRSKEELLAYILTNERARWCAFELNALGDPALTMKLASRKGSVAFDRPAYTTESGASLTLVDSDRNLRPGEQDVVSVRLASEQGGDAEVLELAETAAASGVFQGAITIAGGPAAADGVLQANPPDSVIVTYDDPDDGTGRPATAQDSAHATAALELVSPCPGEGAIGVPFRGQLAAAGGLPPHRFESEAGYFEEIGSPAFEGLGVPQGWSTDEGAWRYTLPFEFPFYGEVHSSLLVSANGYLELGSGTGLEFANGSADLIASRRIAVLWADLVTTGGDIYLNEKLDSASFRWFGRAYHTGDGINCEVELFSDGTIRFGYGRGNVGLSPTVGISAGDGARYLISSLTGSEDISSGPSVRFFPTRLPSGLGVDETTGAIAGSPTDAASAEVSFRVEDSLGQVARRRCFLRIRPDGLTIDEPRQGDLWLQQSEQTIRWQWFGSVGTRVRLDYNLDGSLVDFPFHIADGASLTTRSFAWRLPSTRAPAARIRLQMIENPELFTVSEAFSIVGPTIVLQSPAGGEKWVVGTTVRVLWTSIGGVGARVRIRYNTDGSAQSFPHVLAADAPNSGALDASVPNTPSETCRLRIESLSSPAITASSPGLLAIRPPSLRLIAPNGGECLRSGEETSVTWSSEGNTGAQVLLEWNEDGGTASFPFVVRGGPVPNNGTARWLVPEIAGAAVRIRIRSATDSRFADVADGPMRVEVRCSLRVLAWVPFIAVDEQQVVGARQALLHHEPDAELSFSSATTPLAFHEDLRGKDALLILKQKQGSGVDFQSLGQSLAGAVREFLEEGGAVVLCEQVPESEAFTRELRLIDYDIRGEGTRLCEVAQPQHAIASNVRPNFSGPVNTAWYEVAGAGVERIVTVSLGEGASSTVVAAREIGFGRLAFLGFDFFNTNDSASRILANSLRQPLPASGLRLTSPEPGRAYLDGETVPIRWNTRGDAVGSVRLAYNLTGAADVFPLAIGDGGGQAERGSLDWRPPAIPPGATHLTLRIQARSLADPGSSDVLRGPVYVIHPLAIETASLPEASVGISYRAAIEVRGGVPPYSFETSGLPRGLIIDVSGGMATIAGTPQVACESCAVFVRIRDSIGLVNEVSLPLEVRLRRITLESPSGGELWLYSSIQEVRWSTLGDVGETVGIAFNTDGSTVDFPHAIAERAPIGEAFTWQLPAIDAPRCRLRVQSNEFPQILSISPREFSIVGPTIRLDSPAGGECWEPGRRKTITWRSAGNTGGTVRIELSRDGSTTDYPFLIAEAAPDVGRFDWVVEGPTSDTCRLRVRFNDAPAIEDASRDAFRIAAGCRLGVLVWRFCPGAAAEVIAATIESALKDAEPDLAAEGLLTVSVPEIESRLANQDVLVIVAAPSCFAVGYEDFGTRLKPLLSEFVRQGGVVVVCGPNSSTAFLLLGLGLFVERPRVVHSRADLPCEVASYVHPITRGVPLEFPGPRTTAAYAWSPSGFETLVAHEESPVAGALDDGAGRWVILGFSYEETSLAASRLLANAVRKRPVSPGLRVIAPRAGAVFFAGDAVPIEWAERGGREGNIRIAYNTDGSPSSFPELAGTTPGGPGGGRFEWMAPEPPAGRFHETRLEVRWADAPELPAPADGTFYIVREPLAILTPGLLDGFQFAEYSSPFLVEGGAPPYTLDVTGLPAGLILAAPDPATGVSEVAGASLETGTDIAVEVRVRDFIGLEARRKLSLSVFPSRIELLSPSGGEHLLAGAPHELRWRIEGDVGPTVRIEYNLDGSPRIFPHVAAAEVPAAGPFLWNVPDVRAATCRVRVRSNLRDIAAASERTFAIEPAGITCLSPNGLEVLETGTPRTIRWRSLGNPGGTVGIDMSLDGSLEAFPITIASPVADTGSFEWLIPRLPSETCRIRVRSMASPALTDGSDDLFAIRFTTHVRGLVWTPFTGHHRLEVRGAVAAATIHENDFNWVFSKAVTPEALASELAGKETILVVEQEPSPQVTFKGLGHALGPVLQDFALRGGTVVFLKQSGSARDFLPATGLMDAVEAGRGFDIPCTVVLPDHPVTNQVDESFRPASAAAWYSIAGDDVEVYIAGPGGEPVAAGRDLGDGRVVLIGFDYADYTEASARLLANALRNTRAQPRPRFVRGDADTSGRTDISDAIMILVYLFRGGSAPRCLDAADVDDSAVPGDPGSPIEINDAVVLLGWLFLGGPAPPPPSPRTQRVQHCGPDPQFRDDLGCAEFPPCGG